MSDGFRDQPDIEEQAEAVGEFLTRTGAIGILSIASPLKSKGRQFSEFSEEVDVSSSTLSKRLDEACELGLLKVELESTDYGSNKLYVLTGVGRRLHHRLNDMGVFRTYDKIQTLEEQLDESIEEMRGKIADELYRSGGR